MRDGTGMFALASLPRCATRWLIEYALPTFPNTLIPKAIHGVVTPEMIIDEVEASDAQHVGLVGGGSLHAHFTELHKRWPRMRWGMLVRDPVDNVRSMVAKHRGGAPMLRVLYPSPLGNDALALIFAEKAAAQVDGFLASAAFAGVEITPWYYPHYTIYEGLWTLAKWAGLDPSAAPVAAAKPVFNASVHSVKLLPEVDAAIRERFDERPAVADIYSTFGQDGGTP